MSVNIILVDTKGHIEKDMHTQMRNHSAYIIIIVLTVVQEEFFVKLISFDNLSYSCWFKTKNSYLFQNEERICSIDYVSNLGNVLSYT